MNNVHKYCFRHYCLFMFVKMHQINLKKALEIFLSRPGFEPGTKYLSPTAHTITP